MKLLVPGRLASKGRPENGTRGLGVLAYSWWGTPAPLSPGGSLPETAPATWPQWEATTALPSPPQAGRSCLQAPGFAFLPPGGQAPAGLQETGFRRWDFPTAAQGPLGIPGLSLRTTLLWPPSVSGTQGGCSSCQAHSGAWLSALPFLLHCSEGPRPVTQGHRALWEVKAWRGSELGAATLGKRTGPHLRGSVSDPTGLLPCCMCTGTEGGGRGMAGACAVCAGVCVCVWGGVLLSHTQSVVLRHCIPAGWASCFQMHSCPRVTRETAWNPPHILQIQGAIGKGSLLFTSSPFHLGGRKPPDWPALLPWSPGMGAGRAGGFAATYLLGLA